jgi:transposase
MASLQRKKINGNWYWYLTGCRRKQGKPTPYVIKYIGSNAELLRMLAHPDQTPVEIKSYSYGAVYGLWQVAQESGFLEIFSRYFPSQERNGLSVARTLLVASIYRALKRGSKSSFESWAKETALPELAGFDPAALTAQHFWDQMNTVTEEQLQLVEAEIRRQVVTQVGIPLEVLLYDVTNFYTYVATGNTRNHICQRGHNKQRRNDLRQFNLALLVARRLPIPLWWSVYEGNIPDVASFPKLITQIRSAVQEFTGHDKDITVVVDKGNYSKRIQQGLAEAALDWIAALPLTTLPALPQIKRAEFHPVDLDNRTVLTYRLNRSLWGKPLTLVLTFSEKLREGQLRGFERALKQTTDFLQATDGNKRDLDKLKTELKPLLSREHVGKVLRVSLTAVDGRIKADWSIDAAQYRYLTEEYFGRRLLITTRQDFTDAEVIKGYDGLGAIENVFRRMKDPFHLSVIPEYHWTDQKIRVHVFTCIVGLILTGLLHKRVRDHGVKISAARLLDTLSGIREAWVVKKPLAGTKVGAQRQLESTSERGKRIMEIIAS